MRTKQEPFQEKQRLAINQKAGSASRLAVKSELVSLGH